MKKIAKKIIIILLIVFLICFQYKIFAIKASDLKPNYNGDNSSFVRFGQVILGYIRAIAAVSLVVLLAFFGLKFMFGSLEEKAEYKKHLLPLTIGVAVVLLGTSITNMVLQTTTKTTCTHNFGGKTCGSGACCQYCGMKLPNEHNWVYHYDRVPQNKYAEYYQCSVCQSQKDLKIIGEDGNMTEY